MLGLVLGFAAGCWLRATAQNLVKPRLRSVGGRGRFDHALAPASWLDPFGSVAAVLAGVGWSPRPEITGRDRTRSLWLVVVIAVLAHAVLTAVGLTAYVGLGGSRALLQYVPTLGVLHGSQVVVTSNAQRIALGFGVINLACGLLVLLPLPPLELGVALWSILPRSAGARRLAYRLLEEQWSIVAVLVLLLLPLAGEQPALLQLVGGLGDRILSAIA
ncbi:MAG TPA: hypothetical protein VMH41_00345 [Mycobacteriales bacterium]|nr:hypothetical protein [Mycobacteriales bacterium]